MSVWINGSPVLDLSPFDRGLNYADGLFETMCIRGRAVLHVDRHLGRLSEGCRRLGIDGVDVVILRSEIAERAASQGDGTLKLIITRGAGPRGYRPVVTGGPTRILVASDARATDESAATGVRIRYCRTPASENAALAGLKHLGRLDSVLARGEWSDADIAEGLLRDSRGSIVGGTMTNLFAVREGKLVTPRLDHAGVRGVMRGVVMDAARGAGVAVAEAPLQASDLVAADELFLTNALIGVWPVRELDGHPYMVGPVTRCAQQWAYA